MRRRFVISGLSSFALIRLARSDAPRVIDDPSNFVRALYLDQIDGRRRGAPESEERFLAPFAAGLRELWIAGRTPRAGATAGRIVHVYFGAVLPGHEIALDGVAPIARGPGTASVAVDIAVRGEPRRIVVDLVREGALWRLANIRYPDGEDFLTVRRRLAGR
jgi:hypothetical protein